MTSFFENVTSGTHPSDAWRSTFDQVWVISLKRRPERLARFFSNLEVGGWPFIRPTVFSAIDGDKVGVPKYWQTGGGSYGCLRSHMSILERAIQDDIGSILVLEDDATLLPTFKEEIERFFAIVPTDWECLMLGGQHINSTPIPVAPKVVRAGGGGGIQRTHCYAIRGLEPMRELYRTWANAAVHCDWVMGPCMAKFKTYAPEPFLVGQADGWSDISGQRNPSKFWRPPTGREPVVILRASREVMEGLQRVGWHGGYHRDSETGIDAGLSKVFNDDKDVTPLSNRLKSWLEMIQWEVASMADPAVCTIWHPSIDVEMVAPLTNGQVILIEASSISDAIRQLPSDIMIQKNRRIPIIVLRSSREIMEKLRAEGFHVGYSRDITSGEDRGVQDAFAIATTSSELSARLQRVVRVLDEEAERITNGVATIWHPGVNINMFDILEFDTVEIQAATEQEAIRQRDAWMASLTANTSL